MNNKRIYDTHDHSECSGRILRKRMSSYTLYETLAVIHIGQTPKRKKNNPIFFKSDVFFSVFSSAKGTIGQDLPCAGTVVVNISRAETKPTGGELNEDCIITL